MLSVAIVSAVVTCLAILITLCRVVSYKLILGYATYIDVFFTIALLMFMHGTLGGEMIATMSGLLLALTLTASRYVLGYSKVKRMKHLGFVCIDYPSPMIRAIRNKAKSFA